jgi:hypothetical protein
MPGTRFMLGPAEGRTRVPGMTEYGGDLTIRYAAAEAAVVAPSSTAISP